MEKNELTGIERQLVLKYLMDGKSSISVSSCESEEKASSYLFPFALRPDQINVLEQGIIIIDTKESSIADFSGRDVKVQFYFNKLSLYFISKVQESSAGFAIVIPSVIKKVADKKEEKKDGFAISIFYENGSKSGKKIDVECDFDEKYPLFVSADYKNLIDKYLSEKKSENQESIEGRIHAPKVIYLDAETIVFAAKKNDMALSPGCEYALLLRFPISGPVRERKVYLTCIADDMFENYDCDKLCACAKISSIREEDERFLSEKMKSNQC